MWQVGRVILSGSGAVAAAGPAGVALVREDLAATALEVVAGRADPARFAQDTQARGGDLFLLDLTRPLPVLTLLGGARALAWPFGADHPDAWDAPMLGATIDPAQWVAVDARLSDGEAGGGMALPLVDGAAPAGSVRIGVPGALRPPPPPSPRDEGGPPAEATTATATAPMEPPAEQTAPSAGAASPEPAPSPETEPPPSPSPEPEPETAPGPLPPEPPAPEPLPPEPPAQAAPSTWASVVGPQWAPPSPVSPPAPDPSLNREAFELTITPALLEQLRRGTGAPQGEEEKKDLPPELERTIAPGSRARGGESPLPPPTPEAVLVYAGLAPVDLDRDVVVGRDPSPRALTGRPPASTLRVPSPRAEISRDHCAVMASGPGQWSVMDLGSANGTLLRGSDGSGRSLPPLAAVPLSAGDLIDLGEGITLEFRIRDRR